MGRANHDRGGRRKKVEKTAEGVVLKEDPKYLAGAIQLNADGKVEFVLDTQANGKSADEIYNIVSNI